LLGYILKTDWSQKVLCAPKTKTYLLLEKGVKFTFAVPFC